MFEDLRERSAQAMAEEPYYEEEAGRVTQLSQLLRALTPQQRWLLSLMLFLNITVLGCLCLLVSGRVVF